MGDQRSRQRGSTGVVARDEQQARGMPHRVDVPRLGERGSSPESRDPEALTSVLWRSSSDIFDAIVDSPFLVELQNGTLSEDSFAYYLIQDGRYIKSYLRNLAGLASKAPEDWVFDMLVGHMHGSISAELALFTELSSMLDSTWLRSEHVETSPTGSAYMSWITSWCQQGSFLEGLVSVLPCYWIYARVGASLSASGSPHPAFARWIASYGEVDFDRVAAEALDCVDRLAPRHTESELQRCVDIYRQGSRYEWMFWDSAYSQETWPFRG